VTKDPLDMAEVTRETMLKARVEKEVGMLSALVGARLLVLVA
jgi:hypothetical protein